MEISISSSSSSPSISPSNGSDPAGTVRELGLHDVLMGRGAAATDYQGNLRLRDIVSNRQAEYALTEKRSEKHRIAQEIVGTVHTRGGRFLECSDSLMDAATYRSLPRHAIVWRIVKDHTILANKVKQLLRDAAPQARQRRKVRRQLKSKRGKKIQQDFENQAQASPNVTTSCDPKETFASSKLISSLWSPCQALTELQPSPISSLQKDELKKLVNAFPAQILAQNFAPTTDNSLVQLALQLLQQQQTSFAHTSSATMEGIIAALIAAVLTMNTHRAPSPPPVPQEQQPSLNFALIECLTSHGVGSSAPANISNMLHLLLSNVKR